MKKIFEQINLGNLTIKNRLIRSATMEFGTTKDGRITEKYIELYKSLALGGAGLLITGAFSVNSDSQVKKDMVNIYDDKFIDTFSNVTDIVHKYESKIIPQLAHGGLISTASSSNMCLGPSEIIGGKEMSINDIKKMIVHINQNVFPVIHVLCQQF